MTIRRTDPIDFTPAWSINADFPGCEVPMINGTRAPVKPATPVEIAAYEKSQAKDNDIKYMYGSCASDSPSDPLNQPGFGYSAAQVPSMEALLVLCPNSPKAEIWKANLAALNQPRTRFYPGDTPLLVGKEVEPGTYVAHDVDGCYWERQNADGGAIANNFTVAAKQLKVTIRASDYAFLSQGKCGEWVRQ